MPCTQFSANANTASGQIQGSLIGRSRSWSELLIELPRDYIQRVDRMKRGNLRVRAAEPYREQNLERTFQRIALNWLAGQSTRDRTWVRVTATRVDGLDRNVRST